MALKSEWVGRELGTYKAMASIIPVVIIVSKKTRRLRFIDFRFAGQFSGGELEKTVAGMDRAGTNAETRAGRAEKRKRFESALYLSYWQSGLCAIRAIDRRHAGSSRE